MQYIDVQVEYCEIVKTTVNATAAHVWRMYGMWRTWKNMNRYVKNVKDMNRYVVANMGPEVVEL